MKPRYVLLAVPLLLLLIAAVLTPGKKTSEYPHTSTAPESALLLLAVTNIALPTNNNISVLELWTQFTNGLATTGYVNVTIAGNSFARLRVDTNGVLMGLGTNQNWTYGVTGSISGTTFTLGVDDSAANTAVSNFLYTLISGHTNLFATTLRTNQSLLSIQKTPQDGSFWYTGTNGTPTTNGARSGFEFIPFWRSLRMGEIADSLDVMGINVGSTNFWNDPNIGPCSVGAGSNSFVKAAYASVLGGAHNVIRTNAKFSVIGGGQHNIIETNCNTSIIAGGGRNSISNATAAVGSSGNATIGGGSNNVIFGTSLNSTIGGGGDNIINAREATIAGGFGNNIRLDGRYGFVGGGNNNVLGSGDVSEESEASVIAGGSQNIVRGDYSFIGGGSQNNLLARDDNYCVIVGGELNKIGVVSVSESTHATIGGGSSGLIENDCNWSVIAGGLRNIIRGFSTNSTISGGEDNVIEGNAPFGNILAGRDNYITGTGDYGTIVGYSNQVGALGAIVIGHNGTNATAHSVLIQSDSTNRFHVGPEASTNTGVLHIPQNSYFTATIAGAGNGNTNYTLLAGTNQLYLGSSNVNISAVMQTVSGQMRLWSANITNLSGDTWGITFSSVTNRWRFQSYMYGTNAPSVLTNNTLLVLDGRSEGTNTLVTYNYFAPGL